MNKNHILIMVSVFAIAFFLFGSIANAGASRFTNNCGQAAQGLKLTFSGTIGVNDIGGSIYPFTNLTAWGPGNGIWLSGGTVVNGGETDCFSYPEGLTITSAAWTTTDINTVIGNALNGEKSCRIPTLTHWGILILAALMITSAIFILLKRRKATAAA